MALLGSQAERSEVYITCGTLCMKLETKNLSSDSSHCISFGGKIVTPCKFECYAGKSASQNWKSSIRYCGILYQVILSRMRLLMERNAGVLLCHSRICATLFRPNNQV